MAGPIAEADAKTGARPRHKSPPPPPVTLEAVREALMRMPGLDELEGFGVMGSLGGQQARRFDPAHSDIDVFVVLKDYRSDEDWLRWYHRVYDALAHFDRRVDTMVFTIPMLLKVPGWHAISLASDCPVLYDPEGKVADVFRRIVKAARRAGLVQQWRGDFRVWAKEHVTIGENIVVEVTDDDC